MICPYCSYEVELINSKKLYARDYGFIWICTQYPKCDAYVGCHPGTNNPLGTLANSKLRKFRNIAHQSFDTLWRRKHKKLLRETKQYKIKSNTKYLARSSGYRWLSKKLNIEIEKCHIGMFDIEKCKEVIAVCKPYLNKEHLNQINCELLKL